MNTKVYIEHFEIYLKVPFQKKDLAKDNKMWWNNNKKQWYKKFNACDYDLSEFDEPEFMNKLIDNLGDLMQFEFIECKFNESFLFEKDFNFIMKNVYKEKRDYWLSQKLIK